MDNIDINDITCLMERDSGPRVSIYMETHRTGREIRQDPIRFKNLLREIQKRLHQHGFSNGAGEKFLARANALLPSEDFWTNQSDGLAVFIAPGEFRTFRLPIPFREQVHLCNHFYIKPLLPVIADNRRYYILLLDQHDVGFFEASRYTITPAQLKDAPTDINELLQYNVVEKQIQVHAASPGYPGTGAIYHGHGSAADGKERKKDIAQFIQAIERGVYRTVAAGNRPLVLAGVDYLRAMYRQVNTYHNLMEEGFSTPPVFHPSELLPDAWQCVKGYFEKETLARLDSWNDWSATERTGRDITEILAAARRGKVDTLFYVPDAAVFGAIDPETGEITSRDTPQPEDEDLADLAVIETLKHGGTVYPVDRDKLPLTAGAVCIYRY